MNGIRVAELQIRGISRIEIRERAQDKRRTLWQLIMQH